MKFILLKCALVVLCVSYASFALSLNFDAPYMGNVISQKLDEKTLQKKALEQVLVKVSGNSNIADVPKAQKFLKNPQRLLSQSGFQMYHQTEYYFALFDQLKINDFLTMTHQPIWGLARPKTLVWIVVQDNKGSSILSDSSSLEGSDFPLIEQPNERGISLEFPIMDLEDSKISASDILGKFYNNIAKASSRYSVEYFAAATLQQLADSRWRLDWSLLHYDPLSKTNKPLISNVLTGTRGDVETKMVNQIADFYASQYAVTNSLTDRFTQEIYVNNIRNYNDFSRFIIFLKKLDSVSFLELKTINADQVEAKVIIKGGYVSFKNALKLNQHLLMIAPPKVAMPIKNEKLVVEVEKQPSSSVATTDEDTAGSEAGSVVSEVVADSAKGKAGSKAGKGDDQSMDKKKVIVADPIYFNWQ